jgi:hypothetical protein
MKKVEKVKDEKNGKEEKLKGWERCKMKKRVGRGKIKRVKKEKNENGGKGER